MHSISLGDFYAASPKWQKAYALYHAWDSHDMAAAVERSIRNKKGANRSNAA